MMTSKADVEKVLRDLEYLPLIDTSQVNIHIDGIEEPIKGATIDQMVEYFYYFFVAMDAYLSKKFYQD